MLNRPFFFAIFAVVFAVIGSQITTHILAAKPPHQGQKCVDDGCKVTVMVETWCLTCDIYVDYELTEAKGHNITWQIADDNASRYEFADNGIVFADGFTCQKDGKKFKCTNSKPTEPGVYKYSINLTDTRYNTTLTLDPWVVNN